MTAGPRRRRDRIAVVGGGIGGLAAAAFLRRAGLAATVYEQVAPDYRRLADARMARGTPGAAGGTRPRQPGKAVGSLW